jgi:recombinational DNA repair ATPase RecF
LEAWDDQLATSGAAIINRRLELIGRCGLAVCECRLGRARCREPPDRRC